MRFKILFVGIVFVILASFLFNAIAEIQLTPVQVAVRTGTILIDTTFDIDGYYEIFPFTTASNGGDDLRVLFKNLLDTQVILTLEKLTTSGYWSQIHSLTIFEHDGRDGFVAMGSDRQSFATADDYRNLIETSDEV